MKEFAKNFRDCYLNNHTGAFAAALAYYLVFSIFPVIGVLNFVLSSFSDELSDVLSGMPHFTTEIFSMYIDYISEYPGITIISAAFIAFLYMPFRAIKFIISDTRHVYGIESKDSFAKRNALAFLYTILFLMVLVFTGVTISVGNDFLILILGERLVSYFKFLIPGVAMFVLLSYLYKTGTKKDFNDIWKGAGLASLGWLISSGIFSFYVDTMGKYAIIYGSLGTIMVFFVWIYLTCFCILLGTRFNYVWSKKAEKV